MYILLLLTFSRFRRGKNKDVVVHEKNYPPVKAQKKTRGTNINFYCVCVCV